MIRAATKIFVSALLLVAAPAAQPADLGAVLESAMGSKVPALGLALIENDRIAAIAVRGVRRLGGSEPARPDDAWLIGSDAKPMTAVLIVRLVDRGLLSWDRPLSRMLPRLAAVMRPEYRSVTLRQLLSHRSGLPHDAGDGALLIPFLADRRPLPVQRMDYIAQALKEKPVAPPATSFHYSNTGFLIAAAIAERAAGLPYEQLMRREVFGPLGMRSAGFGPTHPGQILGHHGGKVAGDRDSNPLMFAPAGNIHLSLADWAKFCIDQMEGAKGRGRLLSPASYRLMQTPVADSGIGMPWGVLPSIKDYPGPVLTHAGSDGNWYAVAVLFPKSGNGALVVANAGEDMGGDAATKAVLTAVLPIIGPPAVDTHERCRTKEQSPCREDAPAFPGGTTPKASN